MNNKLKAFTLGEVLVTLLIVGVIAATLIPTLKNIQPDRQKLMFKKAYTTVERIVTELVNDDYLYSETDDAVGLDNTNTVDVNGNDYGGDTKFCRLFAMKVNVVDDAAIRCPGTPGGSGTFGTPSFTTTDNVAFFIPSSTFGTAAKITVDTNGDKEPNCKYNATSCNKPDIFEIFVEADGGIYVNGTLEKQYLKDTNITRELR